MPPLSYQALAEQAVQRADVRTGGLAQRAQRVLGQLLRRQVALHGRGHRGLALLQPQRALGRTCARGCPAW